MSIARRSMRQSAISRRRQRCEARRRPWPPSPTIEATSIAKGIWFLRGAGNSVLFEFDDHLTLFEVYASEANAKAVIDKARSLVRASHSPKRSSRTITSTIQGDCAPPSPRIDDRHAARE
jgi:hypothetical protein